MVNIPKGDWEQFGLNPDKLNDLTSRGNFPYIRNFDEIITLRGLLAIFSVNNPSNYLTTWHLMNDIYTSNREVCDNLIKCCLFIDEIENLTLERIAIRRDKVSERNDYGDLFMIYEFYQNDWNTIVEIFVSNSSIRIGFNIYELSDDRTPKNISRLTQRMINIFLKKQDRIEDDDKESDCWYLIDNYDYFEFYSRRDLRNEIIELRNRNLNVLLAASASTRIWKDGSKIEIASKSSATEKVIAKAISQRFYQRENIFVITAIFISGNEFQELIDYLKMSEEDETIFYEVQVSKSFSTISNITINNKKNGIKSALGWFSEQGKDLLKPLNQIKSIKFTYSNFSFTLSFKEVDPKSEEVNSIFRVQHSKMKDKQKHILWDFLENKFQIKVPN